MGDDDASVENVKDAPSDSDVLVAWEKHINRTLDFAASAFATQDLLHRDDEIDGAIHQSPFTEMRTGGLNDIEVVRFERSMAKVIRPRATWSL